MNNEDMNAKELITGQIHEEGDESGQPPGSTSSAQRPMRRRPGGRPFSGGAGDDSGGGMERDAMPPDITSMLGGQGGPGPKGFFNPKEIGQLKDILIMSLAKLANSEGDGAIGAKLMNGQELEPGELQHILDECGPLKLPESHSAILQKIYQKLSGK